MSEGCVDRVRATLLTHRLLPKGVQVVVAVSGGPDSVALLAVLRQLAADWNVTLRIAHLDHSLRPDSTQDAEFVRMLGHRWHLPTTIERQDVRALCARGGWSLEDGARRIRYQFLRRVAEACGARHIALAHTADDQAETVLLRLLRGAGLLGLGAMPIKRAMEDLWLIRPFLELWRRDLLAYLDEQRLAYREDATNLDPRFMRNRIRHELLPLLERDYNPKIKTALVQLADQSRCDYAYLLEAATRQWKRLAKVQPRPQDSRPNLPPRNGSRVVRAGEPSAQIAIAVPQFLRQPKALQRQLLRQAIHSLRGDPGGWEFRHWLEAERLFTDRPEGTVLDLPGGVQFLRQHGHVVCRLNATP